MSEKQLNLSLWARLSLLCENAIPFCFVCRGMQMHQQWIPVSQSVFLSEFLPVISPQMFSRLLFWVLFSVLSHRQFQPNWMSSFTKLRIHGYGWQLRYKDVLLWAQGIRPGQMGDSIRAEDRASPGMERVCRYTPNDTFWDWAQGPWWVGRHSTTWAIPPVLFALVVFEIGSLSLCPGKLEAWYSSYLYFLL
jgi:hypothetical protein